MVFGLPTPVLSADADGDRFDLGNQPSVRMEQLMGSSERALRISSDPDVAIGQEHVGPLADPGHGSEDVSVECLAAPFHRHSDRRRRNVDTQSRNISIRQSGGEPTRSTSDVYRRAGTKLSDRLVNPAILFCRGSTSEPAVDVQPTRTRSIDHPTRDPRGDLAIEDFGSHFPPFWPTQFSPTRFGKPAAN